MTLGDRIVVMSNGLIQQSGPPLEVYHKPANRFVAAFVGMPPMNFLDGILDHSSSGGLDFVEGSSDPTGKAYRLALTADMSGRLRGLTGKPVVLGIRPQLFSEGAGPASMSMPVRVTEPLGDTVDVFCSTPKHPHIVARVSSRTGARAGGAVELNVDMSGVHVFEPGEFGRNLSVW